MGTFCIVLQRDAYVIPAAASSQQGVGKTWGVGGRHAVCSSISLFLYQLEVRALWRFWCAMSWMAYGAGAVVVLGGGEGFSDCSTITSRRCACKGTQMSAPQLRCNSMDLATCCWLKMSINPCCHEAAVYHFSLLFLEGRALWDFWCGISRDVVIQMGVGECWMLMSRVTHNTIVFKAALSGDIIRNDAIRAMCGIQS